MPLNKKKHGIYTEEKTCMEKQSLIESMTDPFCPNQPMLNVTDFYGISIN
jgi:hypothetical protein